MTTKLTPDDIRRDLEIVSEQQRKLKEQLKEVLVDKDISLRERWALYREVGENMLDKSNWISSFSEFSSIQVAFGNRQDDALHSIRSYIERHEEVTYESLVESILDKQAWYPKKQAQGQALKPNEERIMDINTDAFKEEIMARGLWSFLNDW